MQGQQFDPTRIQLFTAQTTREWMEWSGFTLADVVNEDETPAAKLGAVGFVKAPRGAKSDFDFPMMRSVSSPRAAAGCAACRVS